MNWIAVEYRTPHAGQLLVVRVEGVSGKWAWTVLPEDEFRSSEGIADSREVAQEAARLCAEKRRPDVRIDGTRL